MENKDNSELSRIGTKVTITLPDGKRLKFTDYIKAIRYINSTRTTIDPPIGIPDFFIQMIDKSLIS